jgi:hypothetical protein
MADQKPNGLFITDDAGNVYYLRPEILAQAKMPDEDVKRLKDELAASGKGKDRELSIEDLHTVAGGANVPMIAVSNLASHANLVSHPGGIGGPVMTSTVMCPW